MIDKHGKYYRSYKLHILNWNLVSEIHLAVNRSNKSTAQLGPLRAAKKIFQAILHVNKNDADHSFAPIMFSIQETTRDSTKRIYTYTGKRVENISHVLHHTPSLKKTYSVMYKYVSSVVPYSKYA
jgi:hypothetical protein